MSGLWINIRFGAYHFQVDRYRPWIAWEYNSVHAKENRDKNFKWFAIYNFPGLNKFLNS